MAEPGSDHELEDLLRAAAPGRLPPAGFDHATVLAASRRVGQQRRRRRLAAGGATAVVVVLLSGGAVAVLGPGSAQDTAATAGSAAAEAPAAGVVPPSGPAPTDPAPTDPAPTDPAPTDPAPGSGGSGVGPDLRGTATCGPVDGAVHAALLAAFPELAAQQPFAVDETCPAGTTGAGVVLTVDGVTGRLEVLVGPAAVTSAAGPAGTASTADGRTVTVVAVPAGPSTATLDDVARRVAAALG